MLVAGSLVYAPPTEAGGGKAARYLVRAQNADGGFGGDPGSSSNQLHSGWAALGLAAAGRNPRDVTSGGRSVVDYIRRGAGSDTGSLSRTILVLTASGVSPRSFGGRDLVAELRADRRGDGSFDGLVNQTAFAVMALEAAGVKTRKSVHWLEKQQNQNGGFGFDAEDGSPEDTGYVLEALVAGGRRGSGTLRRAVAYMEDRQKASGGFAGDGLEVNAQATAFAVQGLIAAGRSGREVRKGIAYLRSLQTGSGSIRYARGDGRTPVWVTAEALPALERKSFPLPTVARAEGSGNGSAGGGTGGGAGGAAGFGAAGASGGGFRGSAGGAGAGSESTGGGSRQREDGAGAGPRPLGPAPGGTPIDTGPVDPEFVERAKGSAALGAQGEGSVVGGVIAAASSAVLVIGIRRRLHKGLPPENGPDATAPAE
jgi:prenyltransferase beta subunit